MSNQRILVTGGAGFIGSEVVRQLAARGFDIFIVDNLVNGKRENLEGVLMKNVELAVTDIRDQKSMTSLAGRPMVIFGDGKQTRDFTFVSDTAAGILAAGLSDASVGHTLNLGSGK